jgi:uncharacterized protein
LSVRSPRQVSLETARRLAITRQSLDAPARPARGATTGAAVTTDTIAEQIRRIGYVQLDPISMVAKSHLLVLWSRLGRFDPGLVDEALFGSKQLFEYWSHAASIVPTSDYQLHRGLRHDGSSWSERTASWLAENGALREAILGRIAGEGALPARAFAELETVKWESSGWSAGRDVDKMLTLLWLEGRLVVAGRRSGRKSFDLAERWFPSETPRRELGTAEVVRRQVERSLRALGVATLAQVTSHYNAGRYPGVADVVQRMVGSGELEPASVVDAAGGQLRGEWYVHRDDLPAVERIEEGGWSGATRLLSPFDNLIIDRDRTEALFGFNYRMEIYVPKHKRRYGYYVLPILCGDRLVGRTDLRSNRKERVLEVLSLHVEPGAARPPGGVAPVRRALDDLAGCCMLAGVRVADGALDGVPPAWAKALG